MRYLLFYLLCIITSILSCKKSELQKYVAGDGIYFHTIDSANYSFANQVGIIDRDTVFLEMRVLGPVKNYDREVQLKAADGTTAQPNKHYVLPSVVLKANTNTIAYPVILVNTPDLKENTVRLELEVTENTDFPLGAGLNNHGLYFARFKINFNNTLIKPTYWSSIQSHFGEYSHRKYKFMIDTLGITDFSSSAIIFSEYYALRASLIKALLEYEAINGPLMAENDTVVSFPI